MNTSKGGYQIIDLQNQNLILGKTFKIEGIHDLIESSYNKALLVSNIIIDDIEKNDLFITLENIDNATYAFNLYDKRLKINQDDEIKVSAPKITFKGDINFTNNDETFKINVDDNGKFQIRNTKCSSSTFSIDTYNKIRMKTEDEFNIDAYDFNIYSSSFDNNYGRIGINTGDKPSISLESVKNINIGTSNNKTYDTSNTAINIGAYESDYSKGVARRVSIVANKKIDIIKQNKEESIDTFPYIHIDETNEMYFGHFAYTGIQISSTGDLILREKNNIIYFNDLFTKNNLHYHFLTLTCGTAVYYLEYSEISDTALVVDSIQDLITLTHARSGTKLALGTTYLIFENNVWKDKEGNLLTAVTDSVTTHY